MIWKATDWEYIGEGGKHAIFAFLADTTCTSGAAQAAEMLDRSRSDAAAAFSSCCLEHSFRNKILRIPKEVFRRIKDHHNASISISIQIDDMKTRTRDRPQEQAKAQQRTATLCNRQEFQLAFMKALFCLEGRGRGSHSHEDQEYNYLDEPLMVEFEFHAIPANYGDDGGDDCDCDRDEDVNVDVITNEKNSKANENEYSASSSYKGNTTFLADLKECALQSGKIPSSRRKDWTCYYDDKIKSSKFQGCILPNYRNPQYHHTHDYDHDNNHRNNVLSIELKPKAGYLPTSPLVHPNHRIKYTQSRFQILQQLALDGVFTKGWCGKEDDGGDSDGKRGKFKRSMYDPLDLYPSNDNDNDIHRGEGVRCAINNNKMNEEETSRAVRTRRAIQSLFDCPQNNLKVFYGHDMLYGHDTTRPADSSSSNNRREDSAMKAMKDVLGISSSTDDDDDDDTEDTGGGGGKVDASSLLLEHELQDILCDILIQDEFLQHLQKYQQGLDLIDVDGAILIYERLVTLLVNGGSNDLAEEVIENTLMGICNRYEEGVGFNSKAGSASLEEELRRLLLTATEEGDDFIHSLLLDTNGKSEILDLVSFLQSCRSLWRWGENPVDLETQRDSLYEQGVELINELDVSDCVIFLQMWLMSLSLNDISFFIILSNERQSATQTQRRKKTIQTRHGQKLTYEIKVADYDCKPARKLRSRKRSESTIAKLCTTKTA